MKLFFGDGVSERAYTMRAHRPDVGEIDMDFVLCQEVTNPGLAEVWIRQVTIGSRAQLCGPRSDFRHDPKRRACLSNDECAWPAICVILESLPQGAPCNSIVEGIDQAAIRKLCPLAGPINSSAV
ncbi:siderophore-interacting protein [Sphingobium sp. HWE2-09]|uniref:siderophore-interacting protein n=1 Tax=Sphingobium sp. HWE2-09 TaxID=3108390 RepID=UPI002DD0EE47|nr:siderophore-interacting protein [Sphingobium sp. HWE2-09]